jgi:hypothetical protein
MFGTANINTETGIRYGTIYGHEARNLEETIWESGTDESWKRWHDETVTEIKGILDDEEDGRDRLEAFIKERAPYHSRNDAPELAAKIIADQDGEPATDEDADGVMDRLSLGDNYECDEPSYTYQDKAGNQFLMGHLGGATLIWCVKTDKIVKARLCSPCVPNAGDLSHLDEDGYECYGVPDQYKDSDEV